MHLLLFSHPRYTEIPPQAAPFPAHPTRRTLCALGLGSEALPPGHLEATRHALLALPLPLAPHAAPVNCPRPAHRTWHQRVLAARGTGTLNDGPKHLMCRKHV